MPQDMTLEQQRALALASARRRRAEAEAQQTSEPQPYQTESVSEADQFVMQFPSGPQRDTARAYLRARAAGNEREAELLGLELSGMVAGADVGEGPLETRASRAETAVRGVGQGLFGIGDYAAAGGRQLRQVIDPSREVRDFRENLRYERGRRRGMQEVNPATGGAGQVGGIGISALAGGTAARAPGLVGSAGRQLVLRAGQPVRNLLRLGAGGAAAGGTTAGFESEGDPEAIQQGAALGGVLGPTVGSAVGLVGRGGQAIYRRVADPLRGAMASLARRVGVPVDEIAARAAEFRARTGRGPSLIELLNPQGAEDVAESAAMGRRGSAELLEGLSEGSRRRPERMREAITGGRETVASREVVAREEAAGRAATREARSAGQGRLRQAQARQADELAEVEQGVDAARRELQRRLGREIGTASSRATPEAIETARDVYAAQAMREIGGQTVRLGPGQVNRILNRPAVLRELRDMANASGRGEAERLRAIAEAAGSRQPVDLTLRQLDSLRRAMASAGDRNPAGAYALREAADDLSAVARRNSPEYGQFLDEYAALSEQAAGARIGRGVVSGRPTEIQQRINTARPEDVGARTLGARRAATAAVGDVAAESPESAERLARRMTEAPERFEMTIGPAFPRIQATARNSLEDIGVARARLDQLKRQQQLDLDALRESTGREADAIRDRLARRLEFVRRAESMLGQNTDDFVSAVRDAPADLMQTGRAVARTRLGAAAEEGPASARSVAQQLDENPGLRRRVEAIFTPEEADALFGLGRVEQRGVRASEAAARRGVGQSLGDEERQALLAAVDAGVLSTGRASGAFQANAFLRVLRLVNGSEERALQVARAATDPDRLPTVLNRLRQLGATEQDLLQIRQAFGSGTGVVSGMGAEPQPQEM